MAYFKGKNSQLVLAHQLLAFINQHQIPVASKYRDHLIRIETEARGMRPYDHRGPNYTPPHRQWAANKRIYSALNPLLAPIAQIAENFGSAGKSTQWISNYRSQVRQQNKFPTVVLPQNVMHPIDPDTGLFFAEQPGFDPGDDGYLYLFRSQQWACRRYAEYLITHYGPDTICKATNLTPRQYLAMAQAKPVVLAYGFLVHQEKRFENKLLLRAFGSNPQQTALVKPGLCAFDKHLFRGMLAIEAERQGLTLIEIERLEAQIMVSDLLPVAPPPDLPDPWTVDVINKAFE
jgi:hypothetical protein